MKYSIQSEGWPWVKEAALTTIHKEVIDDQVESTWKRKILKSEHSPIRELKVRAKFEGVERWVADQLVRSTDQSYMGTMRPDRGNKPRDEQLMTDLTDLLKSSNAQNIIDTARKRLCVGKVSKETYELYKFFVTLLRDTEPELAFHCVPNCVYRAGCPEFKTCGHYYKFLDWIGEESETDCLSSIHVRYQAYLDFMEAQDESDRDEVRQLDLPFA